MIIRVLDPGTVLERALILIHSEHPDPHDLIIPRAYHAKYSLYVTDSCIFGSLEEEKIQLIFVEKLLDKKMDYLIYINIY